MTLLVVLAMMVAVGWLTRPGSSQPVGGSGPTGDPGPVDAERLLDLVAILRLATAAGLSLRGALDLAGDVMPGAEVFEAASSPATDATPADLLEEIASRCSEYTGFDSVVLSVRYGLPLDPALERVEVELGAVLRRRREVRVRQLPVQLLFPLVMCVLPAFVLVGVVPVVIAALQL